MVSRIGVAAVAAVALILALGGCGSSDGDDATGARGKVGFLYVGKTDDNGYNEAAYEGSLAVAAAVDGVELIQAEEVPESPAAEEVMEEMVADGATVIFPTSFGHLEPALAVAARHPEVTFFHQGGLQTAANLGTYFGTIWETQYLAGQAAGLATESNRLGFVAAFPIGQSLLTINAFQLGAASVNPDVETEVLFTGSWCEPEQQRAAAAELLRRGADLLAQHQDCTAAVIETAAEAGAAVSGYHYDARALAPESWLTGSAWNWGPLMTEMVETALAGGFQTSRFNGRVRVGLADGAVELASFGGAATPAIRAKVSESLEAMKEGKLRPFDGPVRDQRGRVRIRGQQPSVTELEETDYLVEGVIGEL